MTKNEQHFKRDAWLSARHRLWGQDTPAMDLDFILAEYDNCQPIALIDYKHEMANIDLNSANSKVLTNLGDMAGLPSYYVRYGHSDQDGWWGEVADDSRAWFQIIPLNAYAHGKDMPTQSNHEKISELVFVSWLYELRGRKIPAIIAERIG